MAAYNPEFEGGPWNNGDSATRERSMLVAIVRRISDYDDNLGRTAETILDDEAISDDERYSALVAKYLENVPATYIEGDEDTGLADAYREFSKACSNELRKEAVELASLVGRKVGTKISNADQELVGSISKANKAFRRGVLGALALTTSLATYDFMYHLQPEQYDRTIILKMTTAALSAWFTKAFYKAEKISTRSV